MRIVSVQVENYKSFRSSPTISFEPGFNVIIGQNNVGKTALIDALSVNCDLVGHRSLANAPIPASRTLDDPRVSIFYHLEAGEAEQLLVDRATPVTIPLQQGIDGGIHANNFLQTIRRPCTFQCVFFQNGLRVALHDACIEGFSVPSGTSISYLFLTPNLATRQLELNPSGSAGLYSQALAGILRQSTYAFKAERQNIGASPYGSSDQLHANAENLPEVLNVLQSNKGKFALFNRYVTEILPSVRWISVRPTNSGLFEIRVWATNPDEGRDDLTVPLSQSGTGIGQVLAILYVALETAQPRTIIIDEPQSYLHPGAIRKLIEILKQQRQHQFIVTTHSPEVIAAANPRGLIRLSKEGAETKVEALDVAKEQDLRLALADVGVRLSDVFGSDTILWVEGATEEACFPVIVTDALKQPLLGTKILGVLQTADFEGKDATRVIQIYSKLSGGQGLLPPAIGFIFDREKKSQRELDDLVRRARGHIHFLPRRMYENYLLNPAAIAAILTRDDEDTTQQVSEQEVTEWLQLHRLDSKYYPSIAPEDENWGDHWVVKVHGAHLLEDLFNALTECRVAYSKVAHGLALTEWLIAHASDDLDEVANLLKTILGQD